MHTDTDRLILAKRMLKAGTKIPEVLHILKKDIQNYTDEDLPISLIHHIIIEDLGIDTKTYNYRKFHSWYERNIRNIKDKKHPQSEKNSAAADATAVSKKEEKSSPLQSILSKDKK